LEKPLGPNAITYIVTTYAKKAGVLQKVSPHSCRATCISNALDKKATHRSVQYLAGWSTPLMIQRYDKRREELKNSAAFVVDYSSEEPPKGTALL
jgi:integrase